MRPGRRVTAHKLIVELDFPTIYTANYHRNLEAAFEVHNKAYAKIANAKQMTDGVTHIVKYHGDFDDDASLVLTETDFLDRLSFDSSLDIKFRADSLGRTILFIGYSMSDPNIGLLLHGIWQNWERSAIIARARSCSWLRRARCRRRCSPAGELPF
jgi:SIR2-like domain